MQRPHLRAWLRHEDGHISAHLVSADTPNRRPAVRLFQTEREARDWIIAEALELDALVDWVSN